MARLECGTRFRQTLRSSVNYRRKGAWFDSDIYTVAGEAAIDTGGVAKARLHYGEVRALLRYREEDVAIRCDMEAVDSDETCPLGQRQYIRLNWSVPASERGTWSISVVPISEAVAHFSVQRAVPHCTELSVRRGLKAMPATHMLPSRR